MNKICRYSENDIILREGESIESMFKVLSGFVVLYINYGKKNEYCFGVLSNHRYFGEEGILLSKSSIFTAVAAADCTVTRIGSEDFEGYILENHKNMIDIMKGMVKKMNTLKTHIGLLDNELSFNIEAQEFRKKCNSAVIERYLELDPELSGKLDKKI